jgi:glycosyltransferase involved in cell wall biosynthesis
MNKNRIKVSHVTFDMRIGGAEQVILNLIENTDPLKFDVSILCLESRLGPFGETLEKKGYKLTCLGRSPGFDFSLVAKIRRHIIENSIQVVHCHQYTPYVYSVLGALFTRCRVIFTEHGRFFPDQRKPKRVLVNPLLNLVTDSVNAISAATRDALVNYENFPRHKIQVIYNGIDDTRFTGPREHGKNALLNIDGDAHLLGTVARLDSIKNQQMMIKTLKRVHEFHPNTHLVIVGDGPERVNLENLVKDLGLSSFVIFTGFRQETHLFYQVMDLFLLTSFSEGTAMTLLEAMASRVPCLATNVGGNPEIVEHGKTGYLVPNDDVGALSKKIISLLDDKPLMEKLGKNGQDRFKNRFSVKKMVETYQELYKRPC